MYALTDTTCIRRTTDNVIIPADPANRDYAEYLSWVEAGNTPRPYVLPAPVAPYAIANGKARLVLRRHSLLAAVTAFVAAMPGDAGEDARIMFEYEPIWHRDHPLILKMQEQPGFTPALMDQLFTEADNA